MKLLGIDNQPVYVRASDILMVSKGTAKRPSQAGLRLAGSNGDAQVVMEDVPCLILVLKMSPGQHGIADTAENIELIEMAMAEMMITA